MGNKYIKRRPSYEVKGLLEKQDIENIKDYIQETVKNNQKNDKVSFTFSDYFGDGVKLWEEPLRKVYDIYLKTKEHNKAMIASARDVGWVLKNYLIDRYGDNLIIEKVYQHGKYVNKYTII